MHFSQLLQFSFFLARAIKRPLKIVDIGIEFWLEGSGPTMLLVLVSHGLSEGHEKIPQVLLDPVGFPPSKRFIRMLRFRAPTRESERERERERKRKRERSKCPEPKTLKTCFQSGRPPFSLFFYIRSGFALVSNYFLGYVIFCVVSKYTTWTSDYII